MQTVAGSDGSYLWANVYLDGGKQPAGQTPLVLRRLTPGSHRLGLERVGFVPTTREVWVSPGKRRAISVVLRARR